jgi:hypothetical protein
MCKLRRPHWSVAPERLAPGCGARLYDAGVLAKSLRGDKISNDRALQLILGAEGSDDYSKDRESVHVLAGITRGERDCQSVLDQL